MSSFAGITVPGKNHTAYLSARCGFVYVILPTPRAVCHLFAVCHYLPFVTICHLSLFDIAQTAIEPFGFEQVGDT